MCRWYQALDWSTANDLKLNGDKTEVLHITSRFRNSSSLPCVQICNSSIEPVESARNLGVIVQNDLKMDLFVNNICRSASFALYRFGQIRKFLDKPCTEMLVHAFITCRLDQCNSLLYALPESKIAKLQRIQNSAARLVSLDQFIFKNFSGNITLLAISVLPRSFVLLLPSYQHNMVSDLSLQLHLNCGMTYLDMLRTCWLLLNSNHP